MRHGSLFSGIGGFDLAAEWMGWENVFHCEWNEFGQKVLKHYWPNAQLFTDITKSDFTKYANKIDILSGGFPCQPYSSAGKRLGKNDERHLWPEMLRAIREIAPRYVVGENVRGLTNWNGGLVFDEVQADLESAGYEVAAVVIPAAAVNAPHGRDRVWFVATNASCDANGLRTKGRMGMDGEILEGRKGKKASNRFNNNSENANVTNSNGNGFDQCNGYDEINASEGRINAQCDTNTGDDDGDASHSNCVRCRRRSEQSRTNQPEERQMDCHQEGNWDGVRGKIERCSQFATRPRNWDNFPTQPPICGGDDGLAADTNSGRLEGTITFRRDSEYVERKSKIGLAADTTSTRRREDNGERKSRFYDKAGATGNWDNFPTQSPICSGDDGLPSELDGITFPKWRKESIMGYGNAIVPQIAYRIFQTIEEYESKR